MKLNRESKEELRLELDKALDKVKFDSNNRIDKFSKKDLEMLLFDYDPKTKQKIVGWHSKNLKKLDLSKVSFKGIYFGDEAEKDFRDTNINFNIMDCAYIESGCVDGSSVYDLNICNAKFDNVNLSRNRFNAIGIDVSDIFTVGLKNCSF